MNRKFIEMWRVPQDIVNSQDDDQAIEFAASQVVDSDGFLSTVQEIYTAPSLEIYSTLRLRDGRIFKRRSLPQYFEGKCVGVLWQFREKIDFLSPEQEVSNEKRPSLHVIKSLSLG